MKCSVETRRAPKQQRPDIRRQKWFLRNRSEVLEDGLLPYNPSSLVAASAAGTRTPHQLSDRRSHMDHHLPTLCGSKEWCNSYCSVDGGRYALLNLISVPFNEDPVMKPYQICYTNRTKNLLTAQAASLGAATPVDASNARRAPVNLVDGLWDLAIDNCYMSQTTSNPYFVVDLEKTTTVQKVLMIVQPSGSYENVFRFLDIRVGTSFASGDFSSYTRLEYYEGPPPYPLFEYRTNSATAVTGRYVSVQKKIDGTDFLQVCHLEIFGF
ncbi:Galactose-binding domain-like [Trinorchestia longiramus]|nr:Galactose-binding domain-like [Trinorchestia longiramus]